jgi:AbiJ N-terminal domain 4/HEPN domain
VAIFETYSRREKRLRGETVDLFSYDPIPDTLRVQIVNIWNEFFGRPNTVVSGTLMLNEAYELIHDLIANEVGVFALARKFISKYDALIEFFMTTANTDDVLDVIDVAMAAMVPMENYRNRKTLFESSSSAQEATDDLNARFLQHGLGYAVVWSQKPQLIRKDNEHIHQNAVLPALQLLRDETFEGADAEYRSAHQHYRHGRYDECLTDCLKAFESTMKTICLRRGWDLPEKHNASALIRLCLKKGLLGDFMEQHLGNFQGALESGVPTVRNSLGAHGDGEKVRDVPCFYAEYLLHETAVTIVLLVDAFKALPPLPHKV